MTLAGLSVDVAKRPFSTSAAGRLSPKGGGLKAPFPRRNPCPKGYAAANVQSAPNQPANQRAAAIARDSAPEALAAERLAHEVDRLAGRGGELGFGRLERSIVGERVGPHALELVGRATASRSC